MITTMNLFTQLYDELTHHWLEWLYIGQDWAELFPSYINCLVEWKLFESSYING